MLMRYISKKLFKPLCSNCQKPISVPDGLFCENCFLGLLPLTPPLCIYCAKPITEGSVCGYCMLEKNQIFTGGVSIYEYAATAASMIKKGKYGEIPWIFQRIGIALTDAAGKFNCDYVTGVPVSEETYRKRGFSHTDIISRTISSRDDNLKFISVAKRKHSPPQVSKNRSERKILPLNEFIITSPVPEGKILIVDDVRTTGTTLNTYGNFLKNHGAKELFFLTFARSNLIKR
ncbi:MAG: ComF family protein [Deltaproteobacteria bacterium]|nr:ComF family protein [Deltaproteobacteria bacterium]